MSLAPITSQAIGRYNKNVIVKSVHSVITAGPVCNSEEPEPPYLPPHWSAYTHPEGQLYFYKDSYPRVLTEAYLYRSEILAKIEGYCKSVEKALEERNKTLPDTVEVFLELNEEYCGYYLIDHATRTQFWMDTFSTEDLSLPPVVSPSHLKLLLEELYWNHVEYFPMHFGGLPLGNVDILISILLHGQTDRLTSENSTFPYTAEQCAQFINILKSTKPSSQNIDGYGTCYTARLWSIIINNRFITHCGQEHTRLCRDQSILYETASNRGWLSRSLSRVLFGRSDVYLDRLERLYVDEVIYIDHWRSFVNLCLDDWRSSISWAFPSLISGLLLMLVQRSSPLLGLGSVFLGGASVMSAMGLSVRHEKLKSADVLEVVTYLQTALKTKHKFLSLAILYSLPGALAMWSLGLFMCQVVYIANRMLHPVVAIAVAISFFVIVLGIHRSLFVSTKQKEREEPAVSHELPLYRSEKDILNVV